MKSIFSDRVLCEDEDLLRFVDSDFVCQDVLQFLHIFCIFVFAELSVCLFVYFICL